MAKRKAKAQNKSLKTRGKQAKQESLFHLPGWRIALRIVAVAAIVGLLSWQWRKNFSGSPS